MVVPLSDLSLRKKLTKKNDAIGKGTAKIAQLHDRTKIKSKSQR